jgi:NAD(P)-dependent dehydrogenase (short-subunit alcohol dehydrogenase family)
LILSKSYYDAWKTQLTKSSAIGVIIHVLDQKLDNMNPDFFSYTLSKAALESAMHMQAMSFAPFLRVVGIAPGITLVSGDQTAESFQKAHQQTPLGRSSLPSDIAKGVCYLATANAVTGTTLYVDGGQHLQAINRDIMFLTDLPTKEI